jgi:hypothetical protein
MWHWKNDGQTFKATGAWTKPSNVGVVNVKVLGSGGGGGGGTFFAKDLPDTVTVSCGADGIWKWEIGPASATKAGPSGLTCVRPMSGRLGGNGDV